jgi:hypothetical protein
MLAKTFTGEGQLMARTAPAKSNGSRRLDPERNLRIATTLSEIPDHQLACRVHHKWPSDDLEAGKPLPRGLVASPVNGTGRRQGVYEVRDTCRRCGKVRWKLTLPRRVWDPGASWRYEDPPDWVTIPADLLENFSASAENMARNASRLFA